MYSVEISDLSIENVDDVFRICSHSKLSDPIQKIGIRLKRRWLLEILEKNGPPTKIAYIDGKPVAQILFYPEAAIPFISNPRKDVILIHCIYNPFPEARGKGASTLLLRSLIDDCRSGLRILEGRKCAFIIAKPFETGGGSLDSFYSKQGFKRGRDELFLEVSEAYKPRVETEYKPLPEDEGKALIFYNPLCEYSYPFAVKVRSLLKEIEPKLEIELVDEWMRPWESIKRGNRWLIVNATPIRSFWIERDAFRREVESALG